MLAKSFGERLFILTFDLEEWFHILDIDSLETTKRWENFEVRIHENTNRILEVIREKKLKTTFFVLGWIAEKYPDLIRSISDEGHEIGTHSLNHLLIYESSPREFREDIKRSIDILQNIALKKVRCFRAPGFSIKKESLWAFEILAEEGIEIDSSIFPASRGHGGIKDFNIDHPFKIKTAHHTIKEFPINVYRNGRMKLPFSGGGYFRIVPFRAIVYFSDRSDYMMTYFHPRDFDPDQPVLGDLSLLRKLKSYLGLKKSFERFKKIIERYDFIDIDSAEKLIDWNEVPIIDM